MKATINTEGRLTIVAETEIEAYALSCWWHEYSHDQIMESYNGTVELAIDVETWETLPMRLR